jgi:hypothetical protein
MLARVEWGLQRGSALTKVPSVAKAAFGAKSNLAAGCTQNSPGEASMALSALQQYSSDTAAVRARCFS